jgi:hypothetical protein
MCLALGGLISRLVPLLLAINVYFQLRSKMAVVLQDSKPPFLIGIGNIRFPPQKGINLDTKLLEVRHVTIKTIIL